jgi:hypothetical protein
MMNDLSLLPLDDQGSGNLVSIPSYPDGDDPMMPSYPDGDDPAMRSRSLSAPGNFDHCEVDTDLIDVRKDSCSRDTASTGIGSVSKNSMLVDLSIYDRPAEEATPVVDAAMRELNERALKDRVTHDRAKEDGEEQRVQEDRQEQSVERHKEVEAEVVSRTQIAARDEAETAALRERAEPKNACCCVVC